MASFPLYTLISDMMCYASFKWVMEKWMWSGKKFLHTQVHGYCVPTIPDETLATTDYNKV